MRPRFPYTQTPEESDALRELGNVAFSHAATALSTLVGKRVEISMPSLRVTVPGELEEALVESHDKTYVITLRILGEQQGFIGLVFDHDDAVVLVDMLEGAEPGARTALSGQSEAVLAEVANIMSGAALLAMYRFLKISLIHGTPVIRVRTTSPRDRAALPHGWGTEMCIVVEAEFSVGERVARGEMVISLSDLQFFLDALTHYEGGV